MPRLVLTDRFVAGLHPKGRVAYFDSKTRGLALRGTANGIKTWAFVYRRAGKPKWVTLSAYPAVTLAAARACRRTATCDRRRETRSRSGASSRAQGSESPSR